MKYLEKVILSVGPNRINYYRELRNTLIYENANNPDHLNFIVYLCLLVCTESLATGQKQETHFLPSL